MNTRSPRQGGDPPQQHRLADAAQAHKEQAFLRAARSNPREHEGCTVQDTLAAGELRRWGADVRREGIAVRTRKYK